jgi:protein-disulfide isomerase
MHLKMIRHNLKHKLFFLTKILLIYFIFFLTSYGDNINENKNLIVLGPNEAPVKIKIFSSLTCSHCANFHIKIVPEIKKDYVDKNKVQLIFVDFPLDQAAFNASKLLHCLDKKNQFTYLDNIYKNQNEWTSGSNIKEINNNLKNLVKNLGISNEKFDKCLDDEEISDKILSDRIEGQKKYSINATPTVVINGKKFKGYFNYQSIKEKIEKLI